RHRAAADAGRGAGVAIASKTRLADVALFEITAVAYPDAPAIAFSAHFRLNATQQEMGYNPCPPAAADRHPEWAPLFMCHRGADNLRATFVQYAFGLAFPAWIELPERLRQAGPRRAANADPLKPAAPARLALWWRDRRDIGDGPRTVFIADHNRNRDAAHGRR